MPGVSSVNRGQRKSSIGHSEESNIKANTVREGFGCSNVQLVTQSLEVGPERYSD